MNGATRFGKFEIGKIYYRYFEFRGQRFVLSYLFKKVRTIDGRDSLLMSPVKEEPAFRNLETTIRDFYSFDELAQLLSDPRRRPPFIRIGPADHPLDDLE